MKYVLIWLAAASLPCLAEEIYVASPLAITARPEAAVTAAGPEMSVLQEIDLMESVRVVSQGGPVGQNDLIIRESSFSGAGLSLNGLPLSNGQTEHFNADLPLPPGMLTAPTVRTGFDQARNTEGHLVGTIDLTTPTLRDGASVSAGVSEHASYWLRGQGQQQLKTTEAGGSLSGGAFAGYSEFNQLNLDNDSETKHAGAQLQWLQDDLSIALIGGWQRKKFGATGYYGTNPGWPAREIIEDSLLQLSAQRGASNEQHWSASAMARQLNDDYSLHLPSSLYHNEHDDMTYNGQVSGLLFFPNNYELAWRAYGEQEEIESESLGDHDRYRTALQLIPGYTKDALHVAAGLRGELLEDFNNALLPQALLSYELSPDCTLALSFSSSTRQPSYTELNYESPSSLGNSGLDRQTSYNTEIGIDGQLADSWRYNAAIFYRSTDDAVDWIRSDAEATRWTAANLGTIDSLGAEGRIDWLAAETVTVGLGGLLMDKDNDYDLYSSRYALNYARAQIQISADWQIHRTLRLSAFQGYRVHEENYLRTSGKKSYPATLSAVITPMSDQPWQLRFSIDNLWDDDFQYYPGEDTAIGRRVYASVGADW